MIIVERVLPPPTEFRFATVAVEVFVAQDQGPAGGSGALLRRPECAGVTEMQVARGRGGDASAVRGLWRVPCCVLRVHCAFLVGDDVRRLNLKLLEMQLNMARPASSVCRDNTGPINCRLLTSSPPL